MESEGQPNNNKTLAEIIYEKALKAPTTTSNFVKFFLNANQIVSAGFEFIIKTDEKINYENPAKLSWYLMKFLLIAITYGILTLFTLLFSKISPIYYSTYLTNYSYFIDFLHKQQDLFLSRLSTNPLLDNLDDYTVCIIGWYPVIFDTDLNKSTTIDQYKSWVNTNITGNSDLHSNFYGHLKTDASQQNLSNFNSNTFDYGLAQPYFLGLVDEYNTYVKNKENFTLQAIQLWIIMFCTILFLIPIRYI